MKMQVALITPMFCLSIRIRVTQLPSSCNLMFLLDIIKFLGLLIIMIHKISRIFRPNISTCALQKANSFRIRNLISHSAHTLAVKRATQYIESNYHESIESLTQEIKTAYEKYKSDNTDGKTHRELTKKAINNFFKNKLFFLYLIKHGHHFSISKPKKKSKKKFKKTVSMFSILK